MILSAQNALDVVQTYLMNEMHKINQKIAEVGYEGDISEFYRLIGRIDALYDASVYFKDHASKLKL